MEEQFSETAENQPELLAHHYTEASGKRGQVEEGLHLLAEALAVAKDTGECRWDAELHWLTGTLLLAPIYGWFTASFDTADLREAKALLEELGVKDHLVGE